MDSLQVLAFLGARALADRDRARTGATSVNCRDLADELLSGLERVLGDA